MIGRCAAAARDLEPLEAVMADTAAISGPEELTRVPVCLVCYQPLNAEETSFPCGKCGIPLCSPECAGIRSSPRLTHPDFECGLLAASGLEIPYEKALPLMKCVLPLRMLLLKRVNPLSHSRIDLLMDHNDVRRVKDTLTWDSYQKHVVDFLRIELKLADEFSAEEINRCIGIIRTNGIETKSVRGFKCRSVFPEVSVLSHSCGNSNARCVQKEDSDSIEIRAQRRIEKGEEITISYTSLLSSTRRRRKMLSSNWCFDCECRRCADPTEFGSNLGTLRCQKCGIGSVRMKNPLDFESGYECDGCDAEISSEAVMRIEDEYEAALNSDESRGEELIEKYEAFRKKASGIFHDNHFIVMRIKSQLLTHYGNVPGFFYHELPNELLERKIGLCEEFLAVFTLVDPGASDWRGSTLFELATARTTRAQRALDNNTFSVDKFKAELNEVIKIYEEVVTVLSVEAGGSHLADLRVRARRHVTDIKDLVRFSEFLV